MIPLQRIRSEIAIKAKYRGNGKLSADKELLLARLDVLNGVKTTIEFNSAFWTDAKPQLKSESNGKCAYCEADTAVVAHGDVEHYRPKSVYWWLAYTYDNYLYACQICNQTYKSDNFPKGGASFPKPAVNPAFMPADVEVTAGHISPDPFGIDQGFTLKKYLTAHKAEKAFLLNPYFDKPQTCFAYEADDVLREVRVVPAKPQYARQVNAAEDFYGINRIELLNARHQVYRMFRSFKRSFKLLPEGPDKQDTLDQINDMKSDGYRFAGMCRYFDKKL